MKSNAVLFWFPWTMLGPFCLMFCLTSCCGPMFLGGMDESTRSLSENICLSPFSKPPWKTVHSIRMRTLRGPIGVFVGVTSVHGNARGFRSVLLSPEGMVLFDANYSKQGGLAIKKAMAPFDSMDFGLGLARDVEHLLLAPTGTLVGVVETSKGSTVCQWRGKNGEIVEIERNPSGETRNRIYDMNGELNREIWASATKTHFLPNRMKMWASEPLFYSLDLELLSVETASGP